MKNFATNLVLSFIFVYTSSCKLVQTDGKVKLYDSRGGKVRIDLVTGAMECLALHADPTDNRVRFTDEVGNDAYLRKDVSNCHFTATMVVDNDKEVKIYRTMEDIIALVSDYFCGKKLMQVDGLCEDALVAIGNLAWITSLNIHRQAEGDDANYHRMDENLMPELIPVSKIPPSAEILKRKYTVHHDHESIPPVKAYMTYIFSHLKAQLEEVKQDYGVEVTNNEFLQQQQITTSVVENVVKNVVEDDVNWRKLKSLFLLGEVGPVKDGTRSGYLHTCFNTVSVLMQQLGLRITKKYPRSPHITTISPYVEEGSVSLNELRTYTRYGHSESYHRQEGKFNVNYISLIVPLSKAQIELKNTLRVIAREEGLSAAQQEQLSAKIKEYIVRIKKPRFIIEEYRRQQGKPVFKNYPEQKQYFLEQERKSFEEYQQQQQREYEEFQQQQQGK